MDHFARRFRLRKGDADVVIQIYFFFRLSRCWLSNVAQPALLFGQPTFGTLNSQLLLVPILASWASHMERRFLPNILSMKRCCAPNGTKFKVLRVLYHRRPGSAFPNKKVQWYSCCLVGLLEDMIGQLGKRLSAFCIDSTDCFAARLNQSRNKFTICASQEPRLATAVSPNSSLMKWPGTTIIGPISVVCLCRWTPSLVPDRPLSTSRARPTAK